MKSLLALFVSILLLSPAGAQTPSPSAKEIAGVAERWGAKAKSTSATVSVWQERIREEEYVVFQLRADLDIYQFVLSRDQLTPFVDALKNYQLVVRQAPVEKSSAVGWLYRTGIRLKRLGQDATDDRLLLNIERKPAQTPTLSLTFDSWLMSFGGPDTPADRAYKGITLRPKGALDLQAALEETARAIRDAQPIIPPDLSRQAAPVQ